MSQLSGGDAQATQKRNRKSEDEAECAARRPAEDGDAKAAQKRGRIMPDEVQAHRAACPRQAPLRERAQSRQAKVDGKIEQAAADIGFERPIGLGGDVHADAREFGDADHRNERRGFDQEDEFVDERRRRDFQRLRQKNAPPDIEAGEAERRRRLTLPARHGVQRAAQNFRLIGRGRQRQRPDRRHDRRHVQPVFGEKIVNEQELHEQRNAAKHADIGAAEAPEPGAPAKRARRRRARR